MGCAGNETSITADASYTITFGNNTPLILNVRSTNLILNSNFKHNEEYILREYCLQYDLV